MATAQPARATLDDLYRVEGMAELIGGQVVELMAPGWQPNRIAKRIVRSLDDHAEASGQGERSRFAARMTTAPPPKPSPPSWAGR